MFSIIWTLILSPYFFCDGDKAVVAGFHPAFVGLRSRNQDADLERSGGAHGVRNGEAEAESNRKRCTGQYETSGKHGHCSFAVNVIAPRVSGGAKRYATHASL